MEQMEFSSAVQSALTQTNIKYHIASIISLSEKWEN